MTPDKRVEEIVEKLAVMTCIVNWLGKEALERVKAEMKTTLTQYHQDLMSEVVEKLKTKSVIELFPDANVDFPTYSRELADQVMYKEAYNDGIREAQNIIKSK